MQTKYILVKKEFIYILTSQKIKSFALLDFINIKKEDEDLVKFIIYKKYLTQIIQNFITKIKFDEKDNIVLLLEYPWVKTTFLNTPWLSQKQSEKIIPFETQKKFWKENIDLQHSFYLLRDKKTKTNRAVVYSMEKQILATISALFVKKNLNLQSIEPYIHWLEQEANQIITTFKKSKTLSLAMTFTESYANIFTYDTLGLQKIYTLPIKNKQIDKNFWDSFLTLFNRIFLLREKNSKILLKKEKKYITLDINKTLPSFTINSVFAIRHQELLQQSKYLKLQKKYLNLYQNKFLWNFDNWKKNINLFKQEFSYQQFLIKNSSLIKYLPKIRFYILPIGIIFFISLLLTLEVKSINQENKSLINEYQSYLGSYLLPKETTPNLVEKKLLAKIKELKNTKETQEKYLTKNYHISNLLLEIARVKKDVHNFKIIQLELEAQKIKFTATGNNTVRSKIQNLFSRKFLFLSIKTIDNKKNIFTIEMKQK